MNHIGEVWHELTVIEYVGGGNVRCRCSCGNETTTRYGNIKSGNTKTCGHRITEPRVWRPGTSSGTQTIVTTLNDGYSIVKCENCGRKRTIRRRAGWQHRARCKRCCTSQHGVSRTPLYMLWVNTRHGRSTAWNDFTAFKADVPSTKPGYCLTRIDVTKPIGPGNFTWLTVGELARRRWRNAR